MLTATWLGVHEGNFEEQLPWEWPICWWQRQWVIEFVYCILALKMLL